MKKVLEQKRSSKQFRNYSQTYLTLKNNLLNARRVLLLAKQAQDHAEKTRGAGIEVTQNYTKKPAMPPVTFVGSLCKIHAVLRSKLADVHDVRTWKFVYFRKIFRFSLHNTRDVTRGARGHNSPGAESLRGARKSQKCYRHFFQNSTVASCKTSGLNMRAANLYFAPDAI